MWPQPRKTAFLSLGRGKGVGGDARIRTGGEGFAGLCLTTWPRRHFAKKAGHVMTGLQFPGADNGVRTRDPHLGKVVLYQLSHVRVAKSNISRMDKCMQEQISKKFETMQRHHKTPDGLPFGNIRLAA